MDNYMNDDWYYAPDHEKIGKFKCIKHRFTKELALAGKKGEIWEFSDTHCAAILNSTAANRYFPNEEPKYKKGEEKLIRFPKKDLEMWAKRLGVPKQRSAMVRFANSFSLA